MIQSRNDQMMNSYKIISERFATIALEGLYKGCYECPVM
jgi:hypothetical protein